MTNKELAALVARQAEQIDKLTGAVTALINRDKAVRDQLRYVVAFVAEAEAELPGLVAELNKVAALATSAVQSRRQPDTLERRRAGNDPFTQARLAIIAERGLKPNAWVNFAEIEARMRAPVAAAPAVSAPALADDEDVEL